MGGEGKGRGAQCMGGRFEGIMVGRGGVERLPAVEGSVQSAQKLILTMSGGRCRNRSSWQELLQKRITTAETNKKIHKFQCTFAGKHCRK